MCRSVNVTIIMIRESEKITTVIKEFIPHGDFQRIKRGFQ